MTGLVPQAFIDELLTRCDIVELIESYLPLKKRGNSYLACCPFHNEKTPSFNVIQKKQFYHCFGCGVSGNAISFVMQYLNQDFVEAIHTLAERLAIPVPTNTTRETTKPSRTLYDILNKANLYYQKNLKANQEPIQYLKNRGLDGKIAKRFQLGYAKPGWHDLEHQFRQDKKELIDSGMLITKDNGQVYDRYRQRIMFPIHNRRGQLIGFGGRSITPEQTPKYLNSPETVLFQKNKEVYGLYELLQQAKNPEYIVVVEGFLDVIALAQHDIPQVVATLGTAINSYHIQLLHKHTQQIIFCFDGDKAGHDAAWRALENCLPLLDQPITFHFMLLNEEHDPDSFVRQYGKTVFLEHLQRAQSLQEFFINHLSKNIDLHTISGKTQFMEAVKPYLQRIPKGSFCEFLLDELSKITHLEKHRIEKLMNSTQPHPGPEQQKRLREQPIKRTPSRLLLAMLIQNPHLYLELEAELLSIKFESDIQPIIDQVKQHIGTTSHMTPALLIEKFRDYPCFDLLLQLSVWDYQIIDENISKEIRAIIQLLQKQTAERKVNYLIDKSRSGTLTEQEKLDLQSMLQSRHQKKEG